MAVTADTFGDLRKDAGLKKLNAFLSSRSYISGFSPSQDDLIIYTQLSASPCASEYVDASRWYRHISHFSSLEKAAWPRGEMMLEKKDKTKEEEKKEKDGKKTVKLQNDVEDDLDLFGDGGDEEDAAANLKKMKERKQKEAEEKKKKKQVISKSSLVIEVKPADIKTDLDEVARLCKTIKIEGVTWGAAVKKVPIAFGLFKLQLCCTILDDVVNTNEITDQIEALGMNEEQREKLRKRQEHGDDAEDEEEEEGGLVQSAEIVSFNKL